MTKQFSIKRVLFQVFGGVAAATLLSVGSAAADAPKRCTVDNAKEALQYGNDAALCGCDVVTVGFVRYIQDRVDFVEVVQKAAAQCQRVADVLTDPAVASTRGDRYRYIASDPEGAARGTCSESQCGSDRQTARRDFTPSPTRETKVERETFEQGHERNPDGSTPYGR